MLRTILIAVCLVISCGMNGIAAPQNARPAFKGTMLIQWTDEQRFIYVSSAADPLRFVTSGGIEVRPGRIYTDGGSIPRVFWSVKGFSPWGYGPAYLIHDWLFHQHRCGLDAVPNKFSMAQANVILDEAIGTLMKEKRVTTNSRTRALIKWAVDNFAATAWNEPCDPEPPSESTKLGGTPPVTVGEIKF